MTITKEDGVELPQTCGTVSKAPEMGPLPLLQLLHLPRFPSPATSSAISLFSISVGPCLSWS